MQAPFLIDTVQKVRFRRTNGDCRRDKAIALCLGGRGSDREQCKSESWVFIAIESN